MADNYGAWRELKKQIGKRAALRFLKGTGGII